MPFVPVWNDKGELVGNAAGGVMTVCGCPAWTDLSDADGVPMAVVLHRDGCPRARGEGG